MNKLFKSLAPVKLIRALTLCAATSLALPVVATASGPLPNLSAFSNYAITDLGNNTNFSWNSGPVAGNVLVGNGVKLQESGGNNGGLTAGGKLYTDGTANISGSLQNPVNPVSYPGPGTIASLITAAQNASSAATALGQSPTQTYGNVQNSLTITGNGGVNVINIQNLQNCVLTINGTPSDVFIFNVSGQIQTNKPMILGTGVSASQILFNLTGNGNVFQTSGGNVLYGTYLATNQGQFQFSNLNLTGQLINTGGNVQFVSGSQLNSFVPFASSGGSQNYAPTVTSPTSAGVTSSGATLGGTVTNVGNPPATDTGVIYSTNPNPVGGTKVSAGVQGGTFTVPVSGLSPGMTYYYVAYATNSVGTSYSGIGMFTTPAAPPCPNYVTYNLTWSGNTKFLACQQANAPGGVDNCGNPYVSNASATGTLVVDLCKLKIAGGGFGVTDPIFGPCDLSGDGIVSFTVTVQGAVSGNGTYSYPNLNSGSGFQSDFQELDFLFGGQNALDFTRQLVGQNLPGGGKWEDYTSCNPLLGEFVFDGWDTFGPRKSSFPGVFITALQNDTCSKYNYLQLTSFAPAPNCTSSQATGLNLSSLQQYAIVDLGSGTTLGWNSGPVNGSVLVGNGVTVKLSGGNNGGFSSPSLQSLQYDNTANISGNLQNPITETPVSSSITSAALAQAQAVSNYAASLPPTQTFGNITSATTIKGNGGLNVINVANIQNAPLTLQGGPTDVFVFNVSGTYQTNVPMTLSGVTASQVLFNFTGTSGAVFQTSGGDVSYGTYLATRGGQFQFSNLNLTGQLINTAGNVQFVSGSKIQTPGPFSGCPVPVTTVNCP